MSSDRLASSKSSNWKAGAHVHPTKEKCSSGSLRGAVLTAPFSDEIMMSWVGNAPNHTLGGTVY